MNRFEVDRYARPYPPSFYLENCRAMGKDAAKDGKSLGDNPFIGNNAVSSHYWEKGFREEMKNISEVTKTKQ